MAVISLAMMASGTLTRERRKSLVKDFSLILYQLENSAESKGVTKLITYLNSLLRIKDITPPVSEIMSIIKWQMPGLYHAARLSVPSTSHLEMLFMIDMNPLLAAERLEQYVNGKENR